MKLAMDEVSFERGGTEVHIRKDSGNPQIIPTQRIPSELYGDLLEDLGAASALSSWVDAPNIEKLLYVTERIEP
jgi:hypothetical protein